MKVLFVSQYFYPEVFKGNDIVFDLIEKGHKVTVFTGKPNYPKGKFYKGYTFFNKNTEYIKGAKVIRTPLFPRGKGGGIRLVLNYLSFVFFSYFNVLFRIREKYDLIFVQQLSPVTMALPGLWIKRKQKIPLVLWVLDLWPESVVASSNVKNERIINFLNRIVKKIYNNSDLILISSKFFRKSVLDKCEDKKKSIEYFPNWAEDIFVNENKGGTKSTIELPKGFNIMFAGNIGEAQDFESIVKAAELTLNDKINWIIVGDGRKFSWLKNEIKSKNISNVYLYGRHSLEKMPEFFKKANVMLVSLKDEPIFSLTVPAKVQSYMASKKVVIGMLNGEGNHLINESGVGCAVDSGDVFGLVKAVKEVKNYNNDRILKIEEKSFEYYKTFFSKKKLMNKLETLMLNLISK